MHKIMLLFTLGIFLGSCQRINPDYLVESKSPAALHQSMQALTDVIVHDIFSPPQASRIYAYPSIAAYESARWDDSTYLSLAGQLNQLDNIPQPDATKEYCFPLASVVAFLQVGKKMIFSEQKIARVDSSIIADYKSIQMPTAVFDRSVLYGKEVAKHVLAWAKADNYDQSRSFSRYTVTSEEASWKPTPPGYMDGIEPHWREIRPFTLDSAQQFTPPFPTDFSLDKNSTFYQELMEVYEVRKKLTDEQKEIASFWDCNPYVLNVTGHVMHASKKITPGGHWMGIAAIACKKDTANMVKSAYTYAKTAIALADGFISCWDEKYRSNLIRPETVINEHVDKSWLPLLQTPPFPEYTSGHSVISTAAAVVLTSIYGDNFTFDDDVEVPYGIPIRSFNSFMAASQEAAISRLYGGIHYRPAIDNGVLQGRALGEFVVNELKFKS